MPSTRSRDARDPQSLLEAHVAFELARWSGDTFEDSVTEEVTAAFAWLSGVTASDICGPDEVADAIVAGARIVLADADLRATVAADVVAAAREGVPDDLTLADVIERDEYARMADAAVALSDLRDEVIDQVTASPAYANLLAHVLYHGLKAFVLTENVVAKRVPGASSLVRLGQSAVRSAAPGLERGIDRQLTAFVNAQIADSVKESRRYLDDAMDTTMLRGIADDLWQANADRSLDDALALLPTAPATTMATAVTDVVARTVADGRADSLVVALADRWFERNGDRPLAQVLAQAGITPEAILPDLLAIARPVAAVAVDTGYAEERIRARLAPFYATLDQG